MGLFAVIGLVTSVVLLLLDLSNIINIGLLTVFQPTFYGLIIEMFAFIIYCFVVVIIKRKW